MPEQHLFEYAVIRLVPRVEREEFLNVGVIVYCSAQGFLQTVFKLDPERLRAFCGELDVLELEEGLGAFERICVGGGVGGTIGSLPMAGRFRWLTASRSTVLQTSPVHAGLCADARETLALLQVQLVG